jgi:xylulokinase
VILTVDLGTTHTKVGLWDVDGLRRYGKGAIASSHPGPGRSEQDPEDWWASLRAAAAEAIGGPGGPGAGCSEVEAIGFAAARQTFVPVSADGRPLGPALVWSDARAGAEARALSLMLGGAGPAHQLTGTILDARSVAAKVAWLSSHEPGRLEAARWILAPRDLVVARLTGSVSTDTTLASATGLYSPAGHPVTELVGRAAGLLPPVVPSDAVAGRLRPSAADVLGLPAGIPVVVGAGDRACEVIGSGASAARPMVSWGTTANASIPVAARPVAAPRALNVTRGALGGWILEAGLAAAGSLLEWLASLTGRTPGQLADLAAASPPGARGLWMTPWMGGARAPWWRDDARAAVVGLLPAHDAGDLARAAIEGVAWDVRRSLELFGPDAGLAAAPEIALAAGGGLHPWVEVLTGITGRTGVRRRSGLAALAGAAVLTWRAVGREVSVDDVDPVVDRVHPDPAAVGVYAGLADEADRTARRMLEPPGRSP